GGDVHGNRPRIEPQQRPSSKRNICPGKRTCALSNTVGKGNRGTTRLRTNLASVGRRTLGQRAFRLQKSSSYTAPAVRHFDSQQQTTPDPCRHRPSKCRAGRTALGAVRSAKRISRCNRGCSLVPRV